MIQSVPFLPVTIVIDNSMYNSGDVSYYVQTGLKRLIDSIKKQHRASQQIQISVIACGSHTRIIQDFRRVSSIESIKNIEPEGIMNLEQGVNVALKELHKQVNSYIHSKRSFIKPCIILLTSNPDSNLLGQQQVNVNQIKNTFNQYDFSFWPISLNSESTTLKAISTQGKGFSLPALTLANQQFEYLFSWLAEALVKIAENYGEKVSIAPDAHRNPFFDYGNNRQNKLPLKHPVERDQYGNLLGNEHDLVKDGHFRNSKIAVLHLYTGEGFDFKAPEKALNEKGFVVQRWTYVPDIVEFQLGLADAGQLWIISSDKLKLQSAHLNIIRNFFSLGKGLYIWGDNLPYYQDANFISSNLFGFEMSGNEWGDTTVNAGTNLAKHAINHGLDNLYEGHTVATIPEHPDFTPILIGSSGKIVSSAYQKFGRRAIMDGGFTRLYYKWDSAGTARFVKNAASWLAGYS